MPIATPNKKQVASRMFCILLELSHGQPLTNREPDVRTRCVSTLDNSGQARYDRLQERDRGDMFNAAGLWVGSGLENAVR